MCAFAQYASGTSVKEHYICIYIYIWAGSSTDEPASIDVPVQLEANEQGGDNASASKNHDGYIFPEKHGSRSFFRHAAVKLSSGRSKLGVYLCVSPQYDSKLVKFNQDLR